ncbi:molecular chaperone DnaK [Pseudaestuariivita atlantica]|uniref:Molecular chaperone DnaK n=2 Tax=Pseudaestuariivita atlantica TaxID=1317121 RepID=A0A0L1JLZ3_9RHOB|nr:molecular chaperone DnaK [Pseudaestuariivita atlantica]
MNDTDLTSLRNAVKTRLAELDAEDARGTDAQATVTLDQQMVGRLSRMDALQSQAMARATQTRRDAERARLTDALARMDTEDFGYCEDCGEEIALGRLKLDPAARLCIECQRG